MRLRQVVTLAGAIVWTSMGFGASPAMAGGVCDVGVAKGTLHIVCDDEDNDVVVDQVVFGSDTFRIGTGPFRTPGTPPFGTTLFDVGSGPVAGPVLVSGVTSSVQIDMGGGQEVVGQCIASEQPTGRCPGDRLDVAAARIRRDLKISSAKGRNEVLLVDSEVGGRVKVENGRGGSETDCESSSIARELRYTNASGFNEAKIDECEVFGSVMMSNSGGSSVLDIESETLIHGNVQVVNGDGETHEIGVEESSILGSVLVQNGNAEEIEIEMEAEEGTEIFIGGDIHVENGAAELHGFELEGAEGEDNFTVAGSIRVANGRGDSEVALENVRVEGDLQYSNGRGFDQVELAGIVVGGPTSLATGADGDSVSVADSTFVGDFAADGGKGSDVFEDAGGNDFQAGFRIAGFEVVLP